MLCCDQVAASRQLRPCRCPSALGKHSAEDCHDVIESAGVIIGMAGEEKVWNRGGVVGFVAFSLDAREQA